MVLTAVAGQVLETVADHRVDDSGYRHAFRPVIFAVLHGAVLVVARQPVHPLRRDEVVTALAGRVLANCSGFVGRSRITVIENGHVGPSCERVGVLRSSDPRSRDTQRLGAGGPVTSLMPSPLLRASAGEVDTSACPSCRGLGTHHARRALDRRSSSCRARSSSHRGAVHRSHRRTSTVAFGAGPDDR